MTVSTLGSMLELSVIFHDVLRLKIGLFWDSVSLLASYLLDIGRYCSIGISDSTFLDAVALATALKLGHSFVNEDLDSGLESFDTVLVWELLVSLFFCEEDLISTLGDFCFVPNSLLGSSINFGILSFFK